MWKFCCHQVLSACHMARSRHSRGDTASTSCCVLTYTLPQSPRRCDHGRDMHRHADQTTDDLALHRPPTLVWRQRWLDDDSSCRHSCCCTWTGRWPASNHQSLENTPSNHHSLHSKASNHNSLQNTASNHDSEHSVQQFKQEVHYSLENIWTESSWQTNS